jgi:protein-L-isoaspartate(D-aspartate) O-methyltransferase
MPVVSLLHAYNVGERDTNLTRTGNLPGVLDYRSKTAYTTYIQAFRLYCGLARISQQKSLPGSTHAEMGEAKMDNQFESKRRKLIASLRGSGVSDERVLNALAMTPRELFVGDSLRSAAYDDRALGIEQGQTISQPFMVALMTQALQLRGSERVLEIGTGSGYQTAILARLAAYVYSVERFQELAWQAACRLQKLHISNVSIYVGDGSLGWPDRAPYDRILVTAAAPVVPARLVLQLVRDGILVVPVGVRDHQDLLSVRRTPGQPEIRNLGGCLFVPLVGAEGWTEEQAQV